MIRLSTATESSILQISQEYRLTVQQTLQNLEAPLSPQSRPSDSFLIFIEPQDQLTDLNTQIHRNIDQALEGAFRINDCLIGVVIFGNGGDGVSVVCPDTLGYADEIRQILIKHLPEEESS